MNTRNLRRKFVAAKDVKVGDILAATFTHGSFQVRTIYSMRDPYTNELFYHLSGPGANMVKVLGNERLVVLI